jgi:hypothetical protein
MEHTNKHMITFQANPNTNPEFLCSFGRNGKTYSCCGLKRHSYIHSTPANCKPPLTLFLSDYKSFNILLLPLSKTMCPEKINKLYCNSTFFTPFTLLRCESCEEDALLLRSL